jgi:1-acyl-sn-glycerol-3-phosphate acyltransferase
MKEQTLVPGIKLLDVEKALKDKNPKLYKWLPGFVINYIKRIIHQDELNFILKTYHQYSGVDFLEKVLFEYFNIKVIVKGEENIPKPDGQRYIFVANHPLGGIDGMLLLNFLNRKVGNTKAITNDLLLYIENIRPLFIGVNLYGDKSRNSVLLLEELFDSDNHMMIFPSGLVSRRIHGKIHDKEWKNMFIKRAVKHHRNVVPVHISGRLSNFFYNLSNIRTFLGIKFNIDLLYLPDEMFRNKNKTITLTFGKTIQYTTFDNKFKSEEWADKTRQYLYELGKCNITDFTF